MTSQGRWCRAALLAEIAEDEPLAVTLEGREIALYRLDGACYATGNVCTHAYAHLSDGLMEDGCIECPLHNGRFDIRTGRALSSPVEIDLETYPTRTAGDAIEVLLPD